MKLYEFEGKRLFERAGIAVPRGRVVSSVEEARGAVSQYGSVVAKAQVLWGKRSREQAVLTCDSEEDVATAVDSLLGREIRDEKVEKVLVEEKLDAETEAYVSVTYGERTPLLIVSRQGGVDVEEISREQSDAAAVVPIRFDGFDLEAAEEVVKRAGFAEHTESVAKVLLKLYRMFVADDALLAEINPLIGTPDGRWFAADAKVEIDDDAVYRLDRLSLPDRLVSGRAPTELESLALENDRRDSRGAAGRMFYELPDGNIVVLASGGGTSVEALDDMVLLGGKPAIFTEYSGNPTAEKVRGLTKIALRYPGPIDAVWVVGGRANFTDIYETLVDGVMAGIRETEGFDKSAPVVIRRAGPRDEEAFRALHQIRSREGYNLFLRGVATSIMASARMVMHQAKRHAEARGGRSK